MTRRLTIVLLGIVAAALLLAGAGTLLGSGLADRSDARADLEEQAVETARLLAFVGNRLPDTLPPLRRTLQVDGVSTIRMGAALAGELPPGIELSGDDLAALRDGAAISAFDGKRLTAIAVVPRQPANPELVVVTKDVPLLAPDLTRWFVVASLVTLAVAAVTGVWMTRRTLHPLRAMDRTTRRIAAGDLSARVEVPPRDDELAQLARSVNTMAESIERSRQLERHFLMSVSHDLRTPLTSIRGYAEAVSDGAAPDPSRAASIIVTESRRLERLVGDLLELAKLDARQFSLRPESVDVAELATTAADAFRPMFADEGIALDVAVDASPAPATADPDRLGQVVANLVENALKHANHQVRVAVGTTDGRVRITVADDGAGILPDDLPHVFERLYAGRRQERRQVGSGLGLAIVAELVDAMGGTVTCESSAGDGTAMTVELPAAPTAQTSSPRSS